jgi:hypothetical protein
LRFLREGGGSGKGGSESRSGGSDGHEFFHGCLPDE